MTERREPFSDFRVFTPADFDWLPDKAEVLDTGRNIDIAGGVHELGLTLYEDGESKYSLSDGNIKLTVEGGSKITTISFLPNEGLKFNRENISRLFFKEIPESMYKDLGTEPPDYLFVENATTVRYKLKTPPKVKIPLKMNLVHTGHREDFQDLLILHSDDIISLTMEIESDGMVPFSLTLPNPKNGTNDVMFSFSSIDVLTPETMGVLLGIHKWGFQPPAGEPTAYARDFAAGVNVIREGLRV